MYSNLIKTKMAASPLLTNSNVFNITYIVEYYWVSGSKSCMKQALDFLASARKNLNILKQMCCLLSFSSDKHEVNTTVVQGWRLCHEITTRGSRQSNYSKSSPAPSSTRCWAADTKTKQVTLGNITPSSFLLHHLQLCPTLPPLQCTFIFYLSRETSLL